MALWDFLKSNNTNTQPLQLVQAVPNEQGGVDAQVTQWQPRPTRFQGLGNKLSGLLLGQAAPATDNIGTGNGAPITIKDEITGEDITYTPQNTSTVSQNPRVGGLFRDFTNGMNENFNNGFNINNWGNNQLADGRNKGLAYRLGEGLGSFTRGLGGWAGDAWTAGYNGLDAGLKRQAVRTGDKLYRQQLKDNYGFTDEQLDKARGFISSDTFNNLTKSSYNMLRTQNQLAIAMQRDNTARARMIMQGLNNGTITPETANEMIQAYGITNADFQESNSTKNTQINQYLAPYRAEYYKNAAANPLGWANLGLRADKFNYDKQKDAQEAANEQKIIDSLGGGSTPPAMPKNDGWAF